MNAPFISGQSMPPLSDIRVPATIRDLPIFLCWQFEPRYPGDQKPRKVPYYPFGGKRSGPQGCEQDRAQLTNFADARQQAITRGMTGIGIALLEGYDLVAIDADNCVVGGKLPGEILNAVGTTYAEYSPSGRGIRAIMRGNLGNRKSRATADDWGWEVFSTSGFCTLTGNALDHIDILGLEDVVADVNPEIEAICERRFGSTPPPVPSADDFLAGREPKLGLTVQQMQEFLNALDPDMSRDEWIRVGMALHHETEGGSDGFELWDDWSSAGCTYPSAEDLRTQWKSFERRKGSNRPNITMATVIKMAKHANRSPEGEWPIPTALPDALLPVPEMKPDMLPKELQPWLTDIAERMSVPLDFAAVPAMVMLGALIGRKVLVRPEEFTAWGEPANLWGAIVSPPGAMKTPVVSQVLAPLRQLEKEAQNANKAKLEKHELDLLARKAARDVAMNAVKTSKATPKSAEEFEQALMGCAVDPPKPKLKRFIIADATVEKLGEICADNPYGILYHRDEMPTLFLDLQREEKAAVRGFMLTGWTGLEPYTFDRIARGTTHIEAVNISLFGTAQPQRIANLVSTSSAKHDDGMIQRLQLLAWPDFVSDWVSADRAPDEAARDVAFACCQRLSQLDATTVGAETDKDGGPPFLRLDDEAREIFMAYRTSLEAMVRSRSLPEPLSAHLSKYRGMVPRIALILHLAGGGQGRVSSDAMRGAVEWANYLEAHARRMYASVDVVMSDTAGLILQRIKRGELQDRFTQREISQKGWSGLRDPKRVELALAALQEFGWVRSNKVSTSGRPKEVFEINPAAMKQRV